VFSGDTAVLAASDLYLRIVAPLYVLFGVGFTLYFASQGARRVLVPVLAGTARLVVAGLAGWIAVAWFGAGLAGLFAVVAAGSALYGIVCILAVRAPKWGTLRRG